MGDTQKYNGPRGELLGAVSKAWDEFSGNEWKLDSEGFYFNKCDKKIIDEHNASKANEIQPRVIPQTVVGNLGHAKVVIFNLNMGARDDDFSAKPRNQKVYDPFSKKKEVWHAHAFKYFIESKDSLDEDIKRIKDAKQFSDIQDLYKKITDHLTTKKANSEYNETTELAEKRNDAEIEHAYWYILLPLMQLKFPFEPTLITPALLIDDYYSGIEGNGKSALRISYKSSSKEKGYVSFDNWQQLYGDMVTRVTSGTRTNNDEEIEFEENAFLKSDDIDIKYFEEIMLVQMFPYASINGSALTQDLVDIKQRYNDFVAALLKAVERHNQKHDADQINIVFNRVGQNKDGLDGFINNRERKTSTYRNEGKRPKYLNHTITEK